MTLNEDSDVSNSNTPVISPRNKAKYYRKLKPLVEDDRSERPTKKRKIITKPNINIVNIILDKIIEQKMNRELDDDIDIDIDENDDEDFLDYNPVCPLSGLKKEITYTKDEVTWIKTLTDIQKTELENMENNMIDIMSNDTPLRFRILKSTELSDKSKYSILQQLEQYSNTIGEEHYKMARWINMIEKMPFDKFIPPKFKQNDNDIHNYLKFVKNIMDNEVYGHDIAKTQIISILAREISNPKSIGNVFAIQGPMGNGKTTLVKHGICKAMDRPFGFVPLGGMQDSSFLIGHELTYVGSKPGRIVEILMETNCMNPIFYFDELDKVSDTPKGEEILNVLCHLTDTTQNHSFQDKYFAGIDFNLSRATFIFSYNDESKISPILLDRMNKIKTDGFDTKSKTTIAKKYLLPKMLSEYNFKNEEILLSDEVIQNIINNFAEKENGVRNLKRCLEEIVSKCNILRYDPTGELINFKSKKFSLPIEINNDNLNDFIKKKDNSLYECAAYSMYL
jgi:ATP-dependent Lon protease